MVVDRKRLLHLLTPTIAACGRRVQYSRSVCTVGTSTTGTEGCIVGTRVGYEPRAGSERLQSLEQFSVARLDRQIHYCLAVAVSAVRIAATHHKEAGGFNAATLHRPVEGTAVQFVHSSGVKAHSNQELQHVHIASVGSPVQCRVTLVVQLHQKS